MTHRCDGHNKTSVFAAVHRNIFYSYSRWMEETVSMSFINKATRDGKFSAKLVLDAWLQNVHENDIGA